MTKLKIGDEWDRDLVIDSKNVLFLWPNQLVSVLLSYGRGEVNGLEEDKEYNRVTMGGSVPGIFPVLDHVAIFRMK